MITVKGKHIPENEFPVPEFIEKGFEPKHPLRVYSDIRVNPYICQYCSKSYPNSRLVSFFRIFCFLPFFLGKRATTRKKNVL